MVERRGAKRLGACTSWSNLRSCPDCGQKDLEMIAKWNCRTTRWLVCPAATELERTTPGAEAKSPTRHCLSPLGSVALSVIGCGRSLGRLLVRACYGGPDVFAVPAFVVGSAVGRKVTSAHTHLPRLAFVVIPQSVAR